MIKPKHLFMKPYHSDLLSSQNQAFWEESVFNSDHTLGNLLHNISSKPSWRVIRENLTFII